MNELMDKYASKGLSIVGFPCNQFGHQENCVNSEIRNLLKYVRPGNGYEPKLDLMAKVEVNGEKADPIFKYLKETLPTPVDNAAFINDPKLIIWSPVQRSDIAWNFEKFLIDRNGKPIKRYSKGFQTKDLAKDIEELLG